MRLCVDQLKRPCIYWHGCEKEGTEREVIEAKDSENSRLGCCLATPGLHDRIACPTVYLVKGVVSGRHASTSVSTVSRHRGHPALA